MTHRCRQDSYKPKAISTLQRNLATDAVWTNWGHDGAVVCTCSISQVTQVKHKQAKPKAWGGTDNQSALWLSVTLPLNPPLMGVVCTDGDRQLDMTHLPPTPTQRIDSYKLKSRSHKSRLLISVIVMTNRGVGWRWIPRRIIADWITGPTRGWRVMEQIMQQAPVSMSSQTVGCQAAVWIPVQYSRLVDIKHLLATAARVSVWGSVTHSKHLVAFITGPALLARDSTEQTCNKLYCRLATV